MLYNPRDGASRFSFRIRTSFVDRSVPKTNGGIFRWSWADLEPEEGKYAFDFVDRIISQAKAKGETLAFRIMTEYKAGPPTWLLHKGVGSVPVGGGVFPDYNNPTFLQYHENLIKAFGDRYAGSPDIDHVDIGSVGCWASGIWRCCQGVDAHGSAICSTGLYADRDGAVEKRVQGVGGVPGLNNRLYLEIASGTAPVGGVAQASLVAWALATPIATRPARSTATKTRICFIMKLLSDIAFRLRTAPCAPSPCAGSVGEAAVSQVGPVNLVYRRHASPGYVVGDCAA